MALVEIKKNSNGKIMGEGGGCFCIKLKEMAKMLFFSDFTFNFSGKHCQLYLIGNPKKYFKARNFRGMKFVWHFNFAVFLTSYEFGGILILRFDQTTFNLRHFSFAVLLKIEFFMYPSFQNFRNFAKSMKPKCKLKYIFTVSTMLLLVSGQFFMLLPVWVIRGCQVRFFHPDIKILLLKKHF